MGLWDNFLELWKTPAINYSVVMTKHDLAADLFAAMQYGTSIYNGKLQKALQDYEKIKIAQDKDIKGIYINGTYTYVNEDGSEIPYVFDKTSVIGDITPILKKSGVSIKEEKNTITFDESDYQDYENRYVSIDILRSKSDASDIAFMRIVKAKNLNDTVFPNYDSYIAPGITKNKFKQFILTQMATASQERMQIVENQDSFQTLFFGRKPEIMQIQGILKNTVDNPWSTNMVLIWDELMRGTKLAEKGFIFQMYADGELFTGYPFGFQRSKIAGQDFAISFSFSFVITEKTFLYNNTAIRMDNL